MAQDGQLIIDGLNDDSSEDIMVLKKVKLEGTLTYVIKKNRDGISDKLKKAATSGRVFDRARLWQNAKPALLQISATIEDLAESSALVAACGINITISGLMLPVCSITS